MTKRALITGSRGQDGRYLANLLKEKKYIITEVDKEEGDISDFQYVKNLVSEQFDEIYNLASIATVAKPWDDPITVANVVGMAPLFFLEAIRLYSTHTKFFQASSAEMFGNSLDSFQNESTECKPVNPYGAAKLFAHTMVGEYRDAQNIFAVSGILFNHESPYRSEQFVTKKITSTLARIKNGSEETLELGNLESRRDWSFAGDVVKGMWLSLQHKTPGDYVFASGKTHSVKQFVEAAAKALNINIIWEGEAEKEVGKDKDGRVIVCVNPAFYRPVDASERRGDSSKASNELGWQPEVSFEDLVCLMAQADLKV